MERRAFLIVAGLLGLAPFAQAQSARKATLYKNPQCGCCEDYASYLRSHGYSVDVIATFFATSTRMVSCTAAPLISRLIKT